MKKIKVKLSEAKNKTGRTNWALLQKANGSKADKKPASQNPKSRSV